MDSVSDKSLEYWMHRALQLASLGEGRTSPNPLVGAVVLNKRGNLVGEGFHARAGAPHAEVGALEQAGKEAIDGTLIVTLEPCCHHGRTPPCTEMILASGLKRVVVALEDPDPRVSGSGLHRLMQEGIEVVTGVLQELAAEQNKSFLHRVSTGRPWGILKWGMSFDGRTALTNGVSKWITNETSRDWVHSLRGTVDAVIVGGGTVRTDDPLLTSRGKSTPEPIRVVFSRSLELPSNARVWDTSIARTLIAFPKETSEDLLESFPEGFEKLSLPSCEPIQLLLGLAKKDCNSVLWECGPRLASLAIKQGCIQELAIMMSPKLMGGVLAATPIAELGFTSMSEVIKLSRYELKAFDDDLLLRATLL